MTTSRLLALFCALLLPVILVGCSQPADQSREAHGLVRDVAVCYVNKLESPVTVKLASFSSSDIRVKQLGQYQKFCAEGPGGLQADIEFPDGFVTYVLANNNLFGEPKIEFRDIKGAVTYASAYYSVNQRVNSEVEGKQFSVTRLPDDEWINFEIRIIG